SKRNWCAIADGKEIEEVLAHHTDQLNFTSLTPNLQRINHLIKFRANFYVDLHTEWSTFYVSSNIYTK
ncbi:hypothetical protein, partial [Vibrio xiamenensis]|uniref:hypothetical protein n=1 Tax=Vibrio xiamenensis TaxID=861298 RepID=UPI001C40B979